MNPLPTPDPIPIPGPVWLFEALLLLTFLLHVVFMNGILGGSFLAAVAVVAWMLRAFVRARPAAAPAAPEA